jgi:hypothetical protein
MDGLPIACTLSPAALQKRKDTLLSVLVERAVERQPLSDGYRLRFSSDGDVLALMTRTIDAERQCCRFLRFTMTVEPADGPITLDLVGPAGTREFLTAMFEP